MQTRLDKTATRQTLSLATLWKNFRAKLVARRYVRNVGTLTFASFVGLALSVFHGILVARWLGPELYGVTALVMSYPSLVHGFFDARSAAASVKYLGEYHAVGERDCALAMCGLGYAVDLAVACLTFLVLVLTANLAAESIVHDPSAAGLMILYGAALVPRALVGTSKAVLATFGRFSTIAFIEVVTTFLRVMLVIGLVLTGWGVAGVVWGNAIAATATGILYGAFAWVLFHRAWGGSIFQGSLKTLKGRRREIFAFLAYNDLNAFIAMIPRQLDAVLLGYFHNPTQVGYYKIAKSISSVVGNLTQPLRLVTYAELARVWGLGHTRAFSQKVRNLAVWIGLPLGVLVLLGSGLTSFAVPLLVGEIYLPAVRPTQLLLAAFAMSLAFFWLRPVYLVKGHIREWTIVSSSVTLVFALIYPFVIREWGGIGAAAWTLALCIVEYGVCCCWLWKQPEEDEKYGDLIERNDQTPRMQKRDERLSESVQQS